MLLERSKMPAPDLKEAFVARMLRGLESLRQEGTLELGVKEESQDEASSPNADGRSATLPQPICSQNQGSEAHPTESPPSPSTGDGPLVSTPLDSTSSSAPPSAPSQAIPTSHPSSPPLEDRPHKRRVFDDLE